MMEIDKLTFDPHNPRLLSTRSVVADSEIYRYMLDDCKVLDLMLSISIQGFFQGEPLLVTKSKKNPDKYEVLEGNRRLAAVKLLNDPSLAPVKKESVRDVVSQQVNAPKVVPVLIYETREEVLPYLGYRHITGIEEWVPLAKAKYLTQLKETYADLPYIEVISKLAKIIGSRADYVHRLLRGFKIYEKIERKEFFKIPGLSEEKFEFSLLTTALSYKGIADFVGMSSDKNEDADKNVDMSNLEDLSDWMFRENSEGNTRLGESRNLKTLNAVVSVDRALKSFRAGNTLDDAKYLTDEPKEIFSKSIKKAFDLLKNARDQAYLVSEPIPGDDIIIIDLIGIARDLHGTIKNKLAEKDI